MGLEPWLLRQDWLTLAGWAGQQALPLFAGWLALLLLFVVLAWWLLQAHALPLARASSGQAGAVWLLGGAGLAGLIGAAALFAELAEHLGDGRRLARLDEAFTAALAAHAGAATLQAFAWLTHLGDVATLTTLGVAVAGLLWWRRQRLLAAGWVLAVGGNGLLNPALKRIFERVRPEHAQGLVSEPGFSFPSGHSSSALVAYGMLAYLALRLLPRAWHLPTLLLAVALVACVGASRVFLQVHYASDVLAGFASGAAWLLVSIASTELAMRRLTPL